METILAIDIGGSLTKIGFVNQNGEILQKKIFKTEAHLPFSNFLQRLKKGIDEMTLKLPTASKILHIGVGAPNANSLNGNIENPPNLNWGKKTPLKKMITNLMDLPVTIANDANAAALGELTYGVAKHIKDFVMLTLGTGLGSGIVIKGKLLIGAHGVAGEIGHVNVIPNGRMCNCGLNGCLETYASVTGIKRTVFELLANSNEKSIMRGFSFEELNGENISEAALKGDIIAQKAFDITGEILGNKMADTVAHLDPEAFILSGGLSKAGDILLKPIKRSMDKHLFNTYKGKIKILISKATKEEAILGPAALAWLAVDFNNMYSKVC